MSFGCARTRFAQKQQTVVQPQQLFPRLLPALVVFKLIAKRQATKRMNLLIVILEDTALLLTNTMRASYTSDRTDVSLLFK